MTPALKAGASAPARPTLTPANDNNRWDGRRVLSWPTAARLLANSRTEDLRLLWHWRNLSDLALHEPANDNWRMPAEDGDDSRPADDFAEERDACMGAFPTIGQIVRATDPELWPSWHPGRRPEIIASDIRGSSNLAEPSLRKAWAGLVFDGRNRLVGYRTSPKQSGLQLPREVRTPRRPTEDKIRGLHVQSSSGQWTAEAHIEARAEYLQASAAIGREHSEVLEFAIGPSTAQSIGETRRYVGKVAERWGIRMIDDALNALRAVWSPYNATDAA